MTNENHNMKPQGTIRKIIRGKTRRKEIWRKEAA